MAIAYLSLGSNKGDRIGFVQQATSLLNAADGISLIRTSAFYESEPWGMDTKNWFVNAVVEIKTTLSPQRLLNECQRIEAQLGRKRDIEAKGYQDRTIDIDILFYSKEIVNDENLTIPHKYLHLRAFTLVPLLELIPNFEHPVLHKTITQLHDDLENPEIELAGGSAVGMVLSITVSLISYICNLTIGKKKYENVQDEVIKIKKEAEVLREKALKVIDEDRVVLDKLLKAFKVRKEEPEKLEEASKESVLFCNMVMEDSLETLKLVSRLEKVGNKMLESDFKICKKYAFSSMESSIVNVDINLKYVKDEEFKEKIVKNYTEKINEAKKY